MKVLLIFAVCILTINCSNKKANPTEPSKQMEVTKKKQALNCELLESVYKLVIHSTNSYLIESPCNDSGVYTTREIESQGDSYKVLIHFNQINDTLYFINIDLLQKNSISDEFKFETSRSEKITLEKSDNTSVTGATTNLSIVNGTPQISISGDIEEILGKPIANEKLTLLKSGIEINRIHKMKHKFEKYLKKDLNMTISDELYSTALKQTKDSVLSDLKITIVLNISQDKYSAKIYMNELDVNIYPSLHAEGNIQIIDSSLYLEGLGSIELIDDEPYLKFGESNQIESLFSRLENFDTNQLVPLTLTVVKNL